MGPPSVPARCFRQQIAHAATPPAHAPYSPHRCPSWRTSAIRVRGAGGHAGRDCTDDLARLTLNNRRV